jgi:type VI secretion system secreted protein VgrG
MFDLAFESGEQDLSVRSVRVHEAVSSLFEVRVEAVSPSEDLSFEAIVGRGATLRIRAEGGGAEKTRFLRGVCRSMEQIRVEPSGLSTYAIAIVPPLWLLTQRTNHRLFQHLSAVEIARALLAEWGIAASFAVDEALHPRLELRVQYGESDFDFLCRVLEDAGIAFLFPNREDGATLVLSDDLQALALGEPHETLSFIDDASTARDRPHVTDVRLSRAVQPNQVTIGDHDFRRSPSFQLVGNAGPAGDRLEQYRYRPGAFLVDGTPSDPTARHDEKEGRAQAERALTRAQAATRVVSLRTNVIVTAGQAIAIRGHARSELAPDKRLLITEVTTTGTIGGDVTREVRAAFIGPNRPGSADRWLPAARVTRPRVHGVQSAVVVGPNGQEIHTDELGRVRVQFPWDREGRFDERSSCWIRVSQGWAGGAYGMMALPRVGQEVLVGFVDGDPDHPVVVGRVFNATSTIPYKLPEHATISTWKSASSPGADGSNEILFEDAKGGERLFVQAERDLERLVKRDSTTTIGNDRRVRIAQDDSLEVGGDRRARVSNSDVATVGTRHAVTVGARAVTGSEIVDGRISFTTGEASLTLEGPNVTLDAAAGILLKAAKDISLMAEANITARADVSLTLAAGATLVVRSESGDVVIQGGPFVRINPEVTSKSALAAAGVELPPDVPAGVDLDEDIALDEEHARFDPEAPAWLADRMKPGGPWDFGALGEKYAAFASFHLGAVGAAMGFPEGALLHQAGTRRQARGDGAPGWGDPGNGLWGGTYPYGADPRDQEMTRKGYAFYARRYG